jgi:hypothetical protein
MALIRLTLGLDQSVRSRRVVGHHAHGAGCPSGP